MTSPGPSEVKQVPVSQAVRDYLLRSSSPPDATVRSLAERTAAIGERAGMAVPVEQAALLTLLAGLLNARTAIDIGTFTGISALALARGMGPGGRVITCDVTDEWADLARAHWRRAGVADRIDFRLGSAAKTLAGLGTGFVADLVFIDADKMNYDRYYRAAVPLLRPGGLLILDNVLLEGHVLDPERAPAGLPRGAARVMRSVNAAIAADSRLQALMLPLADGLTVARRK